MSIIEEIYNINTYFKKYGGSVFACIMIIFLLVLIVTYCNILQKQSSIKEDWVNQKCNPNIFPFAGLINAPTNDTIISYTLQNFTDCVQDHVKTTTTISAQPLNVITAFLSNIYLTLSKYILIIADFISDLRDRVTDFIKSVFNVILNFIIPFQQMNLFIMDIVKRITAMLYTIIMVFITIVDSLKDVFGSIIEFLLMSYIALIGVFISLLAFLFPSIIILIPLTVVMTAMLFLIILLMVAYVEIFQGLPPYIPKAPSMCFGKNTLLVLKNNKKIKIQNIKLGSILEDGSIVTAKIKISSNNVPMYYLNGVIVSDKHYVSLKPNKVHEENEWVYVKNHLLSKPINYLEPYLYCLSTSNKKICINNMYFLDWDDMTKPYYSLFKYKNKIKKLLKGFSKYKKIDYELFQKNIYQVKINDKIKNSKVIGKVKILSNNKIKYNLITNTESFYSDNIKHQDFYDLIRNL